MAKTNNFGIYKAAADTTAVKSSSDISFAVINTTDLTLVESVTTTDAFYVTGNAITFKLSITNTGDDATVVIKNGIVSGIVNVEDYVIGGTTKTNVKDTDLNALVITEPIVGAGGETIITIHGTIK